MGGGSRIATVAAWLLAEGIFHLPCRARIRRLRERHGRVGMLRDKSCLSRVSARADHRSDPFRGSRHPATP